MWQYKKSVEQANYVYAEWIFPIGKFFFSSRVGGSGQSFMRLTSFTDVLLYIMW